MSQDEIVYLKYQNLEDLLKVIIYSAQSMLGVIPMLYYIHYNNNPVLFIQTGAVGGVTIHYVVENQKPSKKFIQLKRLSGEFTFVDSIGTDAQSLYVPILGLEKSTLIFPTLWGEKVLGQDNIHSFIKPRKSPRKVRPANEVSEDDINAFLQAIRNFDGYPKLRTLRKMLPSLTPLQINVILHYLERSGEIVIDADGYITWMRNKDHEPLTLGEVAEISSDLKELLRKHPS